MTSKLDQILGQIQAERGGLASIHLAFSEFPAGIKAHFEFYKALMINEDLPLSRAEREFLAVSTSKANQCPYCISHHEEALKANLTTIPPGKAQALVELAETLTTAPWRSSSLRRTFIDSGFDSSQWQHAVMVVSYFNFANRCAHAMELEVEPDFEKTCR